MPTYADTKLCDPVTCECRTIGYIRTKEIVRYGAGVEMPSWRLYGVHHRTPWGYALYVTNDLGHRLTVNADQATFTAA